MFDGHLYPKDQMVCMCTKSKGRVKNQIFPSNKGTRFMGPECVVFSEQVKDFSSVNNSALIKKWQKALLFI